MSLSVASPSNQDNSIDTEAPPAAWPVLAILEILPANAPTDYPKDLRNLIGIEDAEIVEKGLLNVAQRAESKDELEVSTAIYQVLSEQGQPEIRALAQERLDGSIGTGKFRNRVDHFLAHLASETLDPVQITAMVAGVGAFRAMRSLSGLRASERLFPAILKTGQPKLMLPVIDRGLANLGALSFSALVATMTERGMQRALNRSSEVNEPVIDLYARNVLRYTLMLGAGSVARGLNRRFNPASSALLDSMILSGGVFAGAVAADKFERMLGVRSYGQDDTTEDLADGLANLAHFWIGRGISSKLGGRRFLKNETTMFGPGLFTPDSK